MRNYTRRKSVRSKPRETGRGGEIRTERVGGEGGGEGERGGGGGEASDVLLRGIARRGGKEGKRGLTVH